MDGAKCISHVKHNPTQQVQILKLRLALKRVKNYVKPFYLKQLIQEETKNNTTINLDAKTVERFQTTIAQLSIAKYSESCDYKEMYAVLNDGDRQLVMDKCMEAAASMIQFFADRIRTGKLSLDEKPYWEQSDSWSNLS